MSSEQLGAFTFWSIVVALAVAAMYLLASRLRARRPQREAAWRELCLRLELIPRPGKGHVATGQLQGIDYSLHDVGKDWIVELQLDRPLLPSGVVLISRNAWRIRPPFKLRPLRWGPGMTPPSTPTWYANWRQPLSRPEPSAPFLEMATRAAESHEPLRVESRRLVHSLGTGDGLTVNEVRDAVRALESTARNWLDLVASQGLPLLKELPPLPSAFSLLGDVLKERAPRRALLLLNAGIPLTLGVLFKDVQWLFFGALLAVLAIAWSALGKGRYDGAKLLISLGVLATTFAAPWFWIRSVGRETTPSVLSVRAAADLPYRKAEFLRFDDAVFREDLSLPNRRGPVPVVANNWSSGELVTVFAVRPLPEGQNDDTVDGMAVAPTRALRSAAIQTALARGFQLHAHVRFVDFSHRPDTEVADLRGLSLLLWGFPNALWLGWVSVLWRRKVRESRREYEETLTSERPREAA